MEVESTFYQVQLYHLNTAYIILHVLFEFHYKSIYNDTDFQFFLFIF